MASPGVSVLRTLPALSVSTALAAAGLLLVCAVAGSSVLAGHADSPRLAVLDTAGAFAPVRSLQCIGSPCAAIVTFTEHGLPVGTTWSVTVDGRLYSGTDGGFQLQLYNGTYPYTVGNVTGFSASPSSGTVIVTGPTLIEVTINFTWTASPASPTVLGLPPAVAYLVLGAVAGVAAIALAFLVTRRRRKSQRTSAPSPQA
jgi:hypothetical protein